MLRLSALAALAAFALSSAPASAQQVQAGVLECRGGESISFIVGSVSEFNCIYRPDFGPAQQYRARLTRAGIDVGVTAVSGLAWGVFAPTNADRAWRSVRQLRRRDRGRRVRRSAPAPM